MDMKYLIITICKIISLYEENVATEFEFINICMKSKSKLLIAEFVYNSGEFVRQLTVLYS